jgi:hypothetical protein
MKEISYDLKNTTARTQYYKIGGNDMAWLMSELTRYLALCGELSKLPDKEVQEVLNQFWRDKNKDLPKGKTGPNSPESFVSGMLNNIMFGNQYDLSDVQASSIERISRCMEVIYASFNGIAYQPKGEPFQEIKFTQSLFGIR